MKTDQELMQQALDDLMSCSGAPHWPVFQPTITALRERLAQPEQEQDSTCNKTLRAEGKGYPRTCKKCGKGPCIADRVQPEQEHEYKGCACRWNEEGDRTVTCERHQGWLEVIAEWADRAREAEEKLKVAAQQEPDAYGYARRLAEAIWTKHYKAASPQWKPFDDLMGVLTQIDNMTAGLTTPPAAQRQPLTDEEIDDIWNRYCDEMGEASINDAYDIARAIEAAHGMGEKNT